MKFLILFLLLTSTAFAEVRCDQVTLRDFAGLEVYMGVYLCVDTELNAVVHPPEHLQKKLRERLKNKPQKN